MAGGASFLSGDRAEVGGLAPGPHSRGLMCRDLPESLVGVLLGLRAPDWAPGLGEECREMKEGSWERLPEPVATEAASSWSDSSSWSEDREGDGGEAEAEEGAFDDKGPAEAAADACGEEGREARPVAAEVGELGICLGGRWAAEDFLGPWPAEALLLGRASLGSGVGGAAARRPRRFWLRWSSWHWAPRGQTPLREKSGHSSVCFFLHLAPSGQYPLRKSVQTSAFRDT